LGVSVHADYSQRGVKANMKETKKELTTVYKVKKVKGANNLQPMYNDELMTWLLNDPNPNATLDKLKKDGLKRRALSKDNPVKLMKQEMTEEEYCGFWEDLYKLRAYYAIEFTKKGKKIKQSDLAHTYYLPQLIYNANYKYWKKLITEKRFLEHPCFLVVNPNDIIKDKPLQK